MAGSIDLNCDMGESFGSYKLGNDALLMDYISSANIACGFHAGDYEVMNSTVGLAAQKGVAVGAHPGYFDLQGFGRRKIEMSPAEIEAMVLYQIGALYAFTRAANVELTHVKGHGALQNLAQVDKKVALAIARAIAGFSKALPFVIFSHSTAMLEAAEVYGLKVIKEAFADRLYHADGTLVSRKVSGSLIEDPAKAADQVENIVLHGIVNTTEGTPLKIQADTICIHGDTPSALEIAKAVRARLLERNISIKAPKIG